MSENQKQEVEDLLAASSTDVKAESAMLEILETNLEIKLFRNRLAQSNDMRESLVSNNFTETPAINTGIDFYKITKCLLISILYIH
jgi:hypothetical protein